MTTQTWNINELNDQEIDTVNGGLDPVTTAAVAITLTIAAVSALTSVWNAGYTFGKDLATKN